MPDDKKTDIKKHWFHDPRLILVGVLIIGTPLAWYGIVTVVAGMHPAEQGAPVSITNTTPKQPTVQPLYRKLDGLSVEKGKDNPYPVGVMIENLPEVRPQSGLSKASVVYETLVEGGATRFLAVYAGAGNTQKIGPVRSARPYYVQWNAEYDGLYAHAGGSPEALTLIADHAVKDLNGIGRAAPYFWRDTALYAPHNLFTSGELLARALRDQGLESVSPSYAGWTFKDDLVLAERPATEQYVRIKFSGYAFETEYRYRQATNDYERFASGVPHLDALTGESIHAKNVIIQVIPKILAVGEKGRLTLEVEKTGKAFFFMDGKEFVGSWQKNGLTDRTQYFLEDGKPAQLNRGSTWIAVVPEDKAVEAGTR